MNLITVSLAEEDPRLQPKMARHYDLTDGLLQKATLEEARDMPSINGTSCANEWICSAISTNPRHLQLRF